MPESYSLIATGRGHRIEFVKEVPTYNKFRYIRVLLVSLWRVDDETLRGGCPPAPEFTLAILPFT